LFAHAAFLVFFPAAAGTRVVSSDFTHVFHCLLPALTGPAGFSWIFESRRAVFSNIYPIGLNHKNFINNPGGPACQAIARQGLFWYEDSC
jgi:hypothetical protein